MMDITNWGLCGKDRNACPCQESDPVETDAPGYASLTQHNMLKDQYFLGKEGGM
jgi:hypothetical protein